MGLAAEIYRLQSKFPRPEPLIARPICKKHIAERRTRFAGAEHLAPVEPMAMTDAYVRAPPGTC